MVDLRVVDCDILTGFLYVKNVFGGAHLARFGRSIENDRVNAVTVENNSAKIAREVRLVIRKLR